MADETQLARCGTWRFVVEDGLLCCPDCGACVTDSVLEHSSDCLQVAQIRAAAVAAERERIRAYLDDCITYWRKRRDEDGHTQERPDCYVDAFQSARVSLLGELLPEGDTDD